MMYLLRASNVVDELAHVRRGWKFWTSIGVLAILAADIATGLLNFPIRLLLLQIEVLLAESIIAKRWTKSNMTSG